MSHLAISASSCSRGFNIARLQHRAATRESEQFGLRIAVVKLHDVRRERSAAVNAGDQTHLAHCAHPILERLFYSVDGVGSILVGDTLPPLARVP